MLYPAPELEIDIPKDAFKVSLPALRDRAHVTFLLNTHADAEDFPLSLREDFEKADIIMHEIIGWVPESIHAMDRTAQGIDEPVQQDPYGINERKKQLLLGTNVKNGMWDVPAGHMSMPEFASFFGQGHLMSEGQFIYLVLKRDKLALRTLGKRIDAVAGVETNEPRVIVCAGLAHVALANAYIAHDPTAEIRTPRPLDDVPKEVAATINYLREL